MVGIYIVGLATFITLVYVLYQSSRNKIDVDVGFTSDRDHYQVVISGELAKLIPDLAKKTNNTESEVIQKAIHLFSVAADVHLAGDKLAVMTFDDHQDEFTWTEVTGVVNEE